MLRPLADWPAGERRAITGVFTDIDDTLTTDGAITADALEALGRLRDAGLRVVPITGRPAGWSEPFAQTWPVDAIVAENGAVALQRDGMPSRPGMRRLYQQDSATRAANYARMQSVAARVLKEVPQARLAEDSPGRECDIAIDHSEFSPLPPEAIDQVVAIMQSEGMNATVSSIHINGWYGAHNKLEGARWIVRELWGEDLDTQMERWVYVGDSTNDQLMFEAFAHSVGVANIARFLAQLEHKPRWLADGERGAGFAQVADALLSPRQA
jgi:HAD superfamily hydrolase (TIGR01484 family)